jgi:DDE family transposase
MATDCITQVTLQGDGFAKPVVARFDLPDASTDGGLMLFKALDTQLGLTARLAACLDDAREPGKVLHETIELLQQRIFGLCGGYADCNDAARLVHDPIHKLMVGRDPLSGLGLASQPTLSRFENAGSARELRAMMHVLANTVIAQQRRRLHGRATRITIDLDPTDDPTHGQQEFAFFNGDYDTWCYLPFVATVTFNDEPAQFAVAAVLRPGTAPAGLGARGILRALLRKLRTVFPAATFRVRLDGGFATPKLFRFLERKQVEYVVAMASNRRLEKRAQRLMGRARVRSRQTGETAHLYGETWYAARRWAHKRRVIIKAEVVRHPGRAPKNNPRFVVTNLTIRPQAVYEFYCARGDVENRLKELHHGLEMDRTSCSTFLANQFRCCSPWRPTSCFRSCDGGPGRPRVPTRRSPRCGSGWSSSRCGSSARRGGSSCTCR